MPILILDHRFIEIKMNSGFYDFINREKGRLLNENFYFSKNFIDAKDS